MKQVKDLQRKSEDLRTKISKCSADLDNETPLYANQREMVDGWLQAHSDICKEILSLRIAIQRTNLVTMVTVDLGGKSVTKSIAEWIHRRRDLANQELAAYSMLTDRSLREGSIKQSTGEVKEVKLRRYYDPEKRDKMIDMYKSEPTLIDSKLEATNAVTDLMEDAV